MFQSHRNQSTDVLSIFIDRVVTLSRNTGDKWVKVAEGFGSIAATISCIVLESRYMYLVHVFNEIIKVT